MEPPVTVTASLAVNPIYALVGQIETLLGVDQEYCTSIFFFIFVFFLVIGSFYTAFRLSTSHF